MRGRAGAFASIANWPRSGARNQLHVRLSRARDPRAKWREGLVGASRGLADDRLRIYWADGSQTDLECNQEQATLACG